jgi:hypothetical protein
MVEFKSYLITAGISFTVSSIVVLANNYYLYKHACKKNLDHKEVNKN